MAARASALRYRFDDARLTESERVAAGRRLLAMDADYLAARYETRQPLVLSVIDEAVAAGDSSVLPLLVRLFREPGGGLRGEVRAELVAYGDRAPEQLVALLRHADRGLVLGALDVLGTLGAAATDSVAALLGHTDPRVRVAAAHALGELGGAGAAPHLVGALRDTMDIVIGASLEALVALRAVAPVIAAGSDPRPEVRRQAALALGQLEGDGALKALEALRRDDPDAGVRAAAARALATSAATR